MVTAGALTSWRLVPPARSASIRATACITAVRGTMPRRVVFGSPSAGTGVPTSMIAGAFRWFGRGIGFGVPFASWGGRHSGRSGYAKGRCGSRLWRVDIGGVYSARRFPDCGPSLAGTLRRVSFPIALFILVVFLNRYVFGLWLTLTRGRKLDHKITGWEP